MPNIEMFLVEGYPDQQKETLIAALTDAAVTAIDAPADSIRVMLTEMSARNFGIGGKTVQAIRQAPSTWQSEAAIIQVLLIAGRTDEQKSRLIAGLTDAVVTVLGVADSEVRVIVRDVPNTDYGIAGKTAKSLGRGTGRTSQAS